MDNKNLTHTRYKYQYHIVFIPKYRKKQLYGNIRTDVREIIATLCKYRNVEIIAGAVCVDHVHLYVAQAFGYMACRLSQRFSITEPLS